MEAVHLTVFCLFVCLFFFVVCLLFVFEEDHLFV